MARNKGADRAQRALFKFDPAQARLEAAGPGVGRVGARAPCVHHRTQNLPCAVVVAVQSRKISAIGLETRSAVVQRPVLPRRRSAQHAHCSRARRPVRGVLPAPPSPSPGRAWHSPAALHCLQQIDGFSYIVS